MDSLKYYYPDGREILASDEKTAKGKFIELYNHIYYFENRGSMLEDRIQKILYDDCLDGNDFLTILQWKIGAVEPPNVEEQSVKNQWRTIYAKELINDYSGRKTEVGDANLSELLEKLMGYNGIGPVYAITIIYFMSKGKYPIYDKFAHIALLKLAARTDYKALISDRDRHKVFHDDSTNIGRIIDDYLRYIGLLRECFSDEWEKTRDIDRALWTYGHLFNENEKNRKRE